MNRPDLHRHYKPRNERQAHADLAWTAKHRRAQRPHVSRAKPSLLARIDAWLKRHLFACVAVLGAAGVLLAIATAEAGPALALAQFVGIR